MSGRRADACARTPRTAFRTGRGQAGARCRRCGSRGRPLPGPRAVQGVVPAAIGLAGMLGGATVRAARQDAADSAELHRLPRLRAVPYLTLVTLECTPVDIAMSVVEEGGAVYSPPVLRLRDQPSATGFRPGRT